MHHGVHNGDHTPASEEALYQLFRNQKKKRKLDMQHTNFILSASKNEIEEFNA